MPRNFTGTWTKHYIFIFHYKNCFEENKGLGLKLGIEKDMYDVEFNGFTMGLPWHGFTMAWVYHGMGLPWHGFTMAWVYHGMGLPWNGFTMTWVYHGMGLP